jgi:proteasome lid subunit RPN8/RPN11
MSSEIQFGDVEQNEPQKAVRPDRDAHYCIASVGDIDPQDLPIYVDLDVMRDMEAHAHTNTRVELGGVMLGKQCIDKDGVPFVVVTDSLRARHYEATRGSFKFTHETWSQITGERNQFHPDLEMVGWYHTHPGWTVFLSPMDLFICNNFFNRSLDVALVIDPCNDDRGWFQWDESHQTQRTGGFFLTSIRYREQELNHFANLYNHEPIMNSDPRYSGYHISGSSTQDTAMDTRKPWFDLMMVSMLLAQLMFMGFMVMKLNGTPAPQQVSEKPDTESVDPVVENQSLRLALSTLAKARGEEQLANRMVALETDRQQLSVGLDGQLARSQILREEKAKLAAEYDLRDQQAKALTDEVAKLKNRLADAASKPAAGAEGDESLKPPITFGFGTLIATGLASLLLGGGLVSLLQRRHGFDEDDVQIETNFQKPVATESGR